jgi:hypothetical protein
MNDYPWETSESNTPITDHGEGTLPGTVADLVSMFAITEEEVAGIKETEFLYKKALPRGHLIAIVGEPGSGKTTVMEYVCGFIEGTVLYITADISAGDLPEALRRSIAGGYKLLAPDIKVGLSMDVVIEILTRLSMGSDDLSDTTIVIDTLKKITEVISKRTSAGIYKMLRSLTGRGATVICLGHCNKYPDAQGYPIYEGTGDLRSDFDELALLHPVKGDYGIVTTSLYWADQGLPWGKARAMVEPITWTIDVEDNRKVDVLGEWVDTLEESKEKREAMRTADVIREVYFKLTKMGSMNQTNVIESMNGIHGERIIKRVLKAQAGKTWTANKGEHNAIIYSHIPGVELPAPNAMRWGQ